MTATIAEQSNARALASAEPAAPRFPEAAPTPSAPADKDSARPQFLVVPDLAGFHELRIWAESFEDAQRARISCANRMERGGVPPELFAGQIAALEAAEHQIKLGMVRCYRRVVPIGVREWQVGAFGIGEHLLARLLGALGHPRIATPYHWEGEGSARELIADPPFERTVRQLWSYCGHGDATRKRAKGMTAEEAFALGSPRCKMLVHLLAEATIKCRVEPIAAPSSARRSADPTTSPQEPNAASSTANERSASADLPPHPSEPASATKQVAADGDTSDEQSIRYPEAVTVAAARRYRMTYDQARERYATRDDWTDGHRHNASLRLVAKHILRDLWEASA